MMTGQQMQKDKLDLLLERYEDAQKEFESHWLWKELDTTPKEFFAMIHRQVEKSGISKAEWERKLGEAKQAIETQVREKSGSYQKVNFKRMVGIKA